jgi:Ca2+-binding EF-hand superfamily protein
VSQADKDGDGLISFDEFAALIKNAKGTQQQGDFKLAFEYYDATGEVTHSMRTLCAHSLTHSLAHSRPGLRHCH